MGFHARDVRLIFLLEGIIVGMIGSVFGLALGVGFMKLLSVVKLKPPGVSDMVSLPIWWGPEQFALATAFALNVRASSRPTCRRAALVASTRWISFGAPHDGGLARRKPRGSWRDAADDTDPAAFRDPVQLSTATSLCRST